ncbi:MAG: hypothetical protein OEW12_01165 [Deltaproteobacteria bacterium]|nr:hypothetical protein [Deltaproteobacteria bacterium]
MFLFKGSSRDGQIVKRYSRALRLGDSLSQLFSLYDSTGGPNEEAEKMIAHLVDNCLVEPSSTREMAQSRMHTLLRARDIHRYLMEEEDLLPVKIRLFEHLLFHDSPLDRWVKIRELLIQYMDLICRSPMAGSGFNQELYKQQASMRTSRLGRLLMNTALFNFDLDEETPPANLMIRFKKNQFPEHTWEISGSGEGRAGSHLAESGWHPANSLCRWEYLGTDLIHSLLRQNRGGAAAFGGSSGAPEAAGNRQQLRELPPHQLYCRFDKSQGTKETTEQLDLFPVKPDSILWELARIIHRKMGPEGLRRYAMLMDRISHSRRGEAVSLDLAEFASPGDKTALTPRSMKEGIKKAQGVLAIMADAELSRVFTRGDDCTLQTSRLVTVLNKAENWKMAGDAMEALPVPPQETIGRQVSLMVDDVFYLPHGATLAAPFQNMPEDILGSREKDHPYLISLYVYLRRVWAEEWEASQGVVRRTAADLFREAGIWVSPTGRYRAIEGLKRELSHLREAGYLARWRMSRGDTRDAMDDLYFLEAPTRPQSHRALPLGAQG